MKKYITSVFLMLSGIIYSQNYQTVEEVNNACSQLGFSGDEEAEIAVDNILDQIGLFRNFTIQECPGINNAVAKNIETSSGHKERYILYDAEFFSRIENKASSDWAAVSILAHEIAHHLNGHSLNNNGSNHKWELEADYFSGIALAKLGATLEDAQSAINSLKYEKATATHPAKADRLAMIEKGWNKAKGITIVVTEEESTEVEALALFKSGEQAFANREYKSALRSFEKAKDLGYKDAYFYLATMYREGHGVQIDLIKSISFAKKGYEIGSIPSQYLYAQNMYYGDYPLKKNIKEAKRLFNKNYQAKWFSDKFIETNLPIYAYTVAKMYESGIGGVKQSYFNAVSFLKQAMVLDYNPSRAMLSIFYRYGFGVDENLNLALELSLQAANEGSVNAQTSLGTRYYYGHGVEKNYNTCIEWWKKAAEKGDALANANLAEIYYQDRIVSRDLDKAITYLNLAADMGNSHALIALSEFYTDGIESYIKIDINKADSLESKLIDHLGKQDALFYKGLAYYDGRVVIKNEEKGLKILKIAARKGSRTSQYFLKDKGITW